ncbi:hypothetical protein HJC23_009493 [Cyclotella cryptica]|uniref:Nucleotide-diphospho-sugar transferase domain-containing protein n=1 Tax=Cyclotella cryptica TaxID=29204 RepID=A0ABD3P7V1_9STRA|eukprot:CCRYP_017284-RA/>CCRYP_017284-RA protein AED:0.08 eAED:0.08 QI:0/-1/0/1/-1/1/1/0/417
MNKSSRLRRCAILASILASIVYYLYSTVVVISVQSNLLLASWRLVDDAPLPQVAHRSKATPFRKPTKIAAVTDIHYAPIALDWHRRLISLGYSPHQTAIVAADDATLSYFNNRTNGNSAAVLVEPMLHPRSAGWPVADHTLTQQKKRRRIFSSRWIYVLHQLRNGYSVLLTDADNIFVRYLDMALLEDSHYDVIHAYCHNFPIRFLAMGFVACGGMMWLRGNDIQGVDGPAVRYVASILDQCKWSFTPNQTIQDSSSSSPQNSNNSDKFIYNHDIHPTPIVANAASCDDQQVINSKFFSNTLNYTWDTRPNNGFWKREASGKAFLTGHAFKFWDVHTVYRGPVDGYREDANNTAALNDTGLGEMRQCPDVGLSWVAMPHNTIHEFKNLDVTHERILRVKQWYEYCRNETDAFFVGDG